MKTFLYDWGGLNVWLFKLINGIHQPYLDSFMQWGTRLGDHDNFPLYAALIAVAAVLSTKTRGRLALLPWAGVLIVFVLGYFVDGLVVGWLKEWFSYPRPMLALPVTEVHVVGAPEHNLQHSFPSGHTSFAMLVAASLWPVLKSRGRWLAVLFVVWVALSRIVLGAHFPADVLAGALSCLLVVVLLRSLINLRT